MKYKFIASVFAFVLIIVCLAQCKDKAYRLIGKLPVKGAKNIYFNLYQQDEFESATGLYFSIVDSSDQLIRARSFLVGTPDYLENTNDFYSGMYDSVIYISYIHPNEIYFMYDLRTGNSSTIGLVKDSLHMNDSLISRLYNLNKDFKHMWK